MVKQTRGRGSVESTYTHEELSRLGGVDLVFQGHL